MGLDAFRPLRKAAEDIKDKVEDFQARREAKKDAQVLAHIAEVGDHTWIHGSVKVTTEPAFYGSPGIEIDNLASVEDFRAAYPELEDVLGTRTYHRPSPLILGRIDIASSKRDEKNEYNGYYMQQGGNVVFAGAEMLKDVQVALREMAQAMKRNEKPLADIDYIVGVSRLGSVAGHLGFDTFPLADEIERQHQSHELAEKANILGGMTAEKAKEKARKRPATLAVMSKKKFLELYGSN